MKIKDIPFDDYETWSLISSGKTIGVFQCESKLVQNWLRRIQPKNLWELSAVISLVRPGALESGFAEQYVKNKNSKEPIESFGHPIIDDIFKVNHSVLVYQENLLSLAQRLAWPHLPELERLNKSDDLRKAVGKKDQAKVLAVGKEFVEGCIHNGVSQEIADKLFEIIKNCGRYLFNLSHSMAYAYVGYRTAYLKAHYPLQFYTESLNYSNEKGNFEEELHHLVQDAKNAGYKILKPNINYKNLKFTISNNQILFGLKYIKYVGSSLDEHLDKLPNIIHWHDVLSLSLSDKFGFKLRSNSRDALLYTNCFSDTGIDPYVLHTAVSFCECLTDRELKYLFEHLHRFPDITNLPLLIQEITDVVANKKRKIILNSEIIILRQNLERKSDPFYLEEKELSYLGTIVGSSSTSKFEHLSTHSCYACNQVYKDDDVQQIILICVIDEVKTHIIKTGKNKGKMMCKLTVHDSSGQLSDIPIFSDIYDKNTNILIPKNTIQLQLYHKAGRGFMVNSVTQLN